jgi:membrane protein YqaA with SNARE-associated domain
VGFLGAFLTWWGVVLLAALDSSMVFFLPFGIDAIVIYMAARNASLFWLPPLLATVGSLAGTAMTFWIGRKAGEVGLERFVSTDRLKRLQCRVRDSGALAIAVPALMPPPFPLAPFVLTCGALAVEPWRFFVTFGGVRLLRFGAEAALARVYGRGILRILQSSQFRMIVIGFVVLAVVGTIASGVALWRSTRRRATIRPA